MDGLNSFQRNWIGFLATLPRYYPEARYWQEDGLVIGISGLQIAAFNAAVLLHEDGLSASRLAALPDPFTEAGVPFSIQVCSRRSVPACDELVQTHGYIELFTDPVMIREGPLQPTFTNPDVTVRLIGGEDERQTYKQVLIEGFSLPPSIGAEFFNMLLRLREAHQVIAWLGNRPVGAGMLLYADDTAAIYNITTLPAFRRQGVGATIMAFLHNRALSDGYGATVLASSSAGLSLYEKLGYRHEGYQIGYTFPDML